MNAVRTIVMVARIRCLTTTANRTHRRVCVCVFASAMFVNASAVPVIRLTYTSTKICIKNEWHDYLEYIYH